MERDKNKNILERKLSKGIEGKEIILEREMSIMAITEAFKITMGQL